MQGTGVRWSVVSEGPRPRAAAGPKVPESTIWKGQRRGAPEDGQLVPQRQVLTHQGALAPDTTEEAGEDEGDHAGHHRSGRPKVNVDEADGVSRRHRWVGAGLTSGKAEVLPVRTARTHRDFGTVAPTPRTPRSSTPCSLIVAGRHHPAWPAAESRRSRSKAALMSARCVNAWGKLPRCCA
jgi:hypothetical protein